MLISSLQTLAYATKIYAAINFVDLLVGDMWTNGTRMTNGKSSPKHLVDCDIGKERARQTISFQKERNADVDILSSFAL